MSNYDFGFIGTGNMGGALASAVAKSGHKIVLCDQSAEKASALAAKLGCEHTGIDTLARESRFIFLGVKPQMMADMLGEIAPVLAARTDHFVLVSMAAGLSMKKIGAMAGGDYATIRIMPNTPVAVGEGMILCAANEKASSADMADFLAGMKHAGRIDPIDEKLIDAGSAISGCGPAFACLFIEALADGGVECGLPRAKAMEYAAQMLKGTAELLLETGNHPGALKDAVCSPGGSTIAGVHALEDKSFRAACISAAVAAFERTKELGK